MNTNKIIVIGLIGSQGHGRSTEQTGSGVGKTAIAYGLRKKGIDGMGAPEVMNLADSLRDLFYKAYDLPLDLKGNKEFELGEPDDWTAKQIAPYETVNKAMIGFADKARRGDPNVFVKALATGLIKFWPDGGHWITPVIIPDVRQFNEWLFIKACNGYLVEIQREASIVPKQALDCQLLGLRKLYGHPVINNNSTIENAVDELGDLIKSSISFGAYPNYSMFEEIFNGYHDMHPFRRQG